MQRIHLRITGKVQGVGFRHFIKVNAKRLNLKGFAKNTNQGVEAMFEGEEDALDLMSSLCEKGPEGAIVVGVDVHKEKAKENLTTFSIEY